MHAMLLEIEILADEAKKENKPSNTFKGGSFARVAKEISEKYEAECQPSHVESRLKTIRTMWKTICELHFKKSGFGWQDDVKMITCGKNVFDEEVVV